METVSEEEEKIRETLIEILKNSDMEKMTEFKVRLAASERLGIDLSDSNHKSFVRGVVESFLLSTAENTGDGIGADSNVEVNSKEQQGKLQKHVNDEGDLVICQLSTKRSVSIQEFKGRTFVSIREYFLRDGKQLPTAKGISLTSEQWRAFRKSVPAIEQAVMKLQSRLRSEPSGEQNEDVANSMTSPLKHFSTEPHRFNGKNYLCWAQQMELFLKQLKIAYVLTDPCPSVTLSTQASSDEVARFKAAESKWVFDDHICFRHILNFLSDHLYYQYSEKTQSARELWEELKSVYLDEEFGTKRSQVKKYIEFQMVDEKSIFEQVIELNKIADSIVAAGMLICENLHVNVILSKLPPSWKGFCIKLMHMEYLTFTMLMDHIKAEEESCKQDKQGEPSKFVEVTPAVNFVPRIREMSQKRQESEMDGKTIVCYNCGKKGHVAKRCHNKKLRKEINERQYGESSTIPAGTEFNKADRVGE